LLYNIKNILIIFIIILIHITVMGNNATPENEWNIPSGKSPLINGKLETSEWDDAGSVIIDVEDGWQIKVYFKRDNENFFFCFTNLKHNGKELYPEILMEINPDTASVWSQDNWWFHASYQDCEGRGNYNIWNCSPTKEGWSANNFPLKQEEVIEMQISYTKVEFDPEDNNTIKLAFNVTDTDTAYYFWPSAARMDSPDTWIMFTMK
jgi:hypothetical protein